MRPLSKAQVSLFEATSIGSTSSQVVAVGTGVLVRGFAAEPVGTSGQAGEAFVEWRDGDSSGPIGIKYQMPFQGGLESFGTSFGSRNPTSYIEVPGLGVRFSDGLNITVTIATGGGGLQVMVTTIYT